jgi:hypothetical protein
MNIKIALVALFASTLTQVPPAEVIGPGKTVTVAWNHSGLDIQGKPETLAGYELAVTDATVDLVVDPAGVIVARKLVPLPMAPETPSAVATDLLMARGTGTSRLWVRAVDAAGNWSAWSTPLGFTFDGDAPAAPSAPIVIKVEVNVTVNR